MTARVTIRSHRQPARCPCGCGQHGQFCADHAARLAAIREDYLAEAKAKTRDGKRTRSPGRACCCWLDCLEPREPGQQYCWDHAEMDD